MIRAILAKCVCATSTIVLLCGCSGSKAPIEADSSEVESKVVVTTMLPVQQHFHDTVEAWGSVVGDPRRARAISLAHGGQVASVKIAPGQTVKAGQALLTLIPDALVRSALQQAQSTLVVARGELARTEQLASQRLATQSQLATARKSLADAETALAAQRAVGGGAVEESVNAPADGVVTTVTVGLGERVAANAALMSFTPSSALVAQLGVQPEDGAKLQSGMSVKLLAVHGPSPEIFGRLTMIGQAIDPQSHLLPAQVEIPPDASTMLVAGAALKGQIQTADYAAWGVPRAAVLRDDKGDYLFQVDSGNARRVDVTLRSSDGDTVGVQGEIDAHAKVIVSGVYELNDGDAVQEPTT